MMSRVRREMELLSDYLPGIKFSRQRREARLIHRYFVGLIKRKPIQQPSVTLTQFPADSLVGAADCDLMEHLVGDEVRHSFPVSFADFAVQFRHDSFPP